jgi:HD-GYP domain-containing protein (c-di-GMP phosphodiesterase class II)
VAKRLSERGDDDDPVSMGLRLKQLEEELREVQTSICRGLNQLLDLKDLSTGTHGSRIGETAVRVSVALGMDEDEQRDVEIACTLHDIGKIGVPDRILRKSGRLAEDEWAEMRRHPEYGWAILRLFPGLEEVSLYVLHHHERWDGGGYPGSLAGAQIPLGARVVAIVDAWDAMISTRPYRAGIDQAEALRRLRREAGSHFDPEIAETFCRMIEAESRAGEKLPSLADPPASQV